MSDRTNILLEAKVPEEWIQRFDMLAKERGRSRTDIVLEALAQYLGMEANEVLVKSELEGMKGELATLQDRVTKTERYGQQLAVMMSKLQQLERTVLRNDKSKEDSIGATPQSNASDSTSVSSNNSDILDDYDEDDLYDEPDEILADFLPSRYKDEGYDI